MCICNGQLCLPSRLVGAQLDGCGFPLLALARVYSDCAVVSDGIAIVLKKHPSGDICVSGLYSIRSNLPPHHVSGIGLERASSSGESRIIIHLTTSRIQGAMKLADVACRDQYDNRGSKRKGDRAQVSLSGLPTCCTSLPMHRSRASNSSDFNTQHMRDAMTREVSHQWSALTGLRASPEGCSHQAPRPSRR
jgi:hypothetical protein